MPITNLPALPWRECPPGRFEARQALERAACWTEKVPRLPDTWHWCCGCGSAAGTAKLLLHRTAPAGGPSPLREPASTNWRTVADCHGRARSWHQFTLGLYVVAPLVVTGVRAKGGLGVRRASCAYRVFPHARPLVRAEAYKAAAMAGLLFV
jgi:hypothetical protein